MHGISIPPARKPVLIILHQETSTPGRVGQALTARGYALDIRRPRFGDPLPDSMRGHAGAIIFGGPMSANDPDEFIRSETDWFAVPLKEQAPLLGICLGAQMLTRHLGGKVYGHPEGQVEIGYYPICPTAQGRALAPWPEKVYQWHREAHDLPDGACCLASSDVFDCQAYSYGPAAIAIQFHVELTLAMVHRWTTRGAERLNLPGAKPRAQHFAERHVHDLANRAFLNGLLDHWLERDGRISSEMAAE